MCLLLITMVRTKVRCRSLLFVVAFLFADFGIFLNLFYQACFFYQQKREKHRIVCEELVRAIASEGIFSPKKAQSLSRYDGYWSRVCRRYFNTDQNSLNQVKSIYDFWRRNKGGIQEKFRQRNTTQQAEVTFFPFIDFISNLNI